MKNKKCVGFTEKSSIHLNNCDGRTTDGLQLHTLAGKTTGYKCGKATHLMSISKARLTCESSCDPSKPDSVKMDDPR